jgi:uncharacterized membrane protein YfcA
VYSEAQPALHPPSCRLFSFRPMADLTAKDVLLLVLAIVTLGYMAFLAYSLAREKLAALATGFFTNFWDTLGIGSFATTTAIFRHWKMVPDEHIPGTLNVGHTIPAIAQAFIFTQLVDVESRTLVFMILAAVSGAWLGAGVVSRWPRRWVQVGMGSVLLAFVVILTLQVTRMPSGGTALALTGPLLVIGVVGNFVLGAIMTLGIGLYAPCMILVSLLGMNPTAAFPIMMGSCAFLMPIASARFVRARSFDPAAAISLTLGGLPAVFLAAFLVKSLPLTWIRVLVILVVIYTGVGLLRAAHRERSSQAGVKGAPEAATT